jgi:hypothetical protein
MGTWGPALFSNDLACDVRDTYRELLEDGVDDAEAVSRTLQEFAGSGYDDESPLVWLVLAFTMSKVGRLTPHVRDRALAIIGSGEDLRRWEHDPALRRKREAALVKVRAQLEGPQPKRKKLRPPRRHETDLRPGDVLAYRTDRRALCFRVARIDDSRYAVAPILVALDHDRPAIPSERRLRRLNDRVPDRRPDRGDGFLPDWHVVTFHVTGAQRGRLCRCWIRRDRAMPPRNDDSVVEASAYYSWENLANDLDRITSPISDET